VRDLPVGNVAGLEPLDLVTGAMLGSEPQPPLPEVPEGIDPRVILRDVFARALEGGDCYVSFSGGRDSSVTLALATDVARERGLPQPIPITLRFPDHSAGHEDDHQELVVSHLGLDDWVRIDAGADLELLGPVATRTLRRHGLLFPCNSFTMVPLLEAASGGRLVLGMGPSDFFSYWRLAKLADLLQGRRRPRLGDLQLAAYALSPRGLRTRMVESNRAVQLSWLRPEMAERTRHALAVWMAHAPLRFDSAVNVERTHRCNQGALRCLRATSAAAGTDVVLPYYDPAFHVAVTRRLGWRGLDRTTSMDKQVGHLLPEHAINRRDSVNFRGVLWGERTRAYAEAWNGEGLDEELLVDPDALRAEWLSEKPDMRSATLLQLAWLTEEVQKDQKADEAAGLLAAQSA
jgi:hypothetical protein